MQVRDIFSLGELFEKIQLNNIFPDGKTFVDCTPVTDLSTIRNMYDEERSVPGFDLSAFVHRYFILPEDHSTGYKSVSGRPIEKHIEMLWDELSRQPGSAKGSLIALPHSYIVPGGRFREIYYWDSYFTMLGLQISQRSDMIQNMVDNFSYLIDEVGYIPNGNRRYYLGRSQPPFFACMVNLLSQEKGEDILTRYLPQLQKEYDFWMTGVNRLNVENPSLHRIALLPSGEILNHYWDENDTPRPESFKEDTELAHHSADKKAMYRHLRAAAESGWDFSSRWFKDPAEFSSIHTTEIIPVDLNCLLFYLEKAIARAYLLLNDATNSSGFETAAEHRKKAIDGYCWNEGTGSYFDYDYVAGRQKELLTLAAAFPLFFEIASKDQAAAVARTIEQKLLMPRGLATTNETTGQQWDAPNGWAPLQWITVQGLAKYGFNKLARDIARRWLNLNEKVYRNTGKMMEKYNVVSSDLEAGGGEYPAQDGFGWTNGVYLALKKWI